jgi:hypothetical protein
VLTAVLASLILLPASGAARAQDAASRPAYPIASGPTAAPRHHIRHKAPRRAVAAKLPPARPHIAPKTARAAGNVATLPLPPRAARPAAKTGAVVAVATPAVPLPPSRASAPPRTATAALPRQEPQAFAPPITLGGRNEWRVITDAATGVVIGLPGRLLTQSHDLAHGTEWSSPHGEVRLATFRYSDPSLTLAGLFEREKREPAARRVEYSKLNDGGFVVSGIQGLKNFSVRASAKDGEIRGFTLLYDQAMETIVAPVMVAMATAFTPFPDRPAPFAHPLRPVEYGSGIVVSARGDILTSARMAERCASLIASGLGRAERVAAQDGLALLRVYGAKHLAPLPIGTGAAGDLRIAGVPDPRGQKGSGDVRDLDARAFGDALALARPLPLAGYAGAAVLDAQGRLAGLVELSGTQVASAGAPPLRMLGADAIRRVLVAHGVEPQTGPAGHARSAVERVICVRN